MNKPVMIFGTFILSAIPLAAIAQKDGGGWASQPQTRSEAEARAKARFARLDTNRDGTVTPAEIEGAKEAVQNEAQSAHFDAMDKNKDGMISRAEFDESHKSRAGHRMRMRGGRGAGKGTMAMRADANGDGKVTEAEMVSSVLNRFDAVDTNKDGTVTPEERRSARMGRRMRKQ